jgi:serine/threonine protein kinase
MRITDSIQLREMVGEGGMGQIWAAEHLLLHRPVAIKRLASHFADNIEALQRFAAEAQAGAGLESANVTRVFDYALLPDGTPFMVMELLDGVELYSRIRDGRTITLPETTQIVVQMCAALTSIHDAGIVHRDVKPENIFLVPNKGGGFTAKLLDFGIAKGPRRVDCDDLARPGMSILGTPAYMSPEQLENAQDVDARADLWSLAVVAYCCLTGTMPFGGDSLSALGLAIRHGSFASPLEHRPELPLALDAWFRKALSADRELRFTTAAEMAGAFVRAVTKEEPVAAPRPAEPMPRLELVVTPVPSPAPVIRRRQRRPGLVGVIATVAALAATTVAVPSGLLPTWSAASVRHAMTSVVQLARVVPTALGSEIEESAAAPWLDARAKSPRGHAPTSNGALAP